MNRKCKEKMKLPKKRTLAITTVAMLAIFCAAVVVPQLGESLAFASTNVTRDPPPSS